MRSSTVYDFSDPLPPTLYWDASFIVNATYEAARYLQPCADFLARLDEQTTVSYVVPNINLYTCNPAILSRQP